MFRVFLISVLINSFINACGGFWSEDYEFRFLHKREFGFANITKNLNHSSTYNDLIYNYKKKVKEINLKEWENEFKNKFSKNEIEEFLYEQKNLFRIKNKEILEYIKFLDKQTPYVLGESIFFYQFEKKDKETIKLDIQNLINEAQKKILQIDSSYLKLRYFFLALRLAHYNNLNAFLIYEKNKNLLENNDKTIVKDWIQGLYAGILVKKGKLSQGVYEFTKLFEEDKLNWYLSFYNFKYIKSDKSWNKLLSFAKNDNEKIKFFVLRALSSKANVIEELKNIANVDINSKYYDLVLFREVLKSQEYFDIIPSWRGKKVYRNYKPFIEYLKSIKKENMYVTNLALSYFSFYEKNINESKSYLKEALNLVEGENIHELDALDYIIYLNSLKTINKDIENNIAKKLLKLNQQSCNRQSIHRYTFHKIKDLYKNKNDSFKYFLTSNINTIDMNSINLQRYKNLKTLEIKKDKTALEEYILEYIKSKHNFDKNLNHAYLNILLNNLKFKEALGTKEEALNKKIEFNIFNNFIYGNNRKKTMSEYTLKESLEKLVEIKNNLIKNPNSIMDNYLYATALYNLSYWGNSNILTTVYKSNYYYKEKTLEENKIKLSLKHFKKALDFAKNKEFKVKIVYMLAKSELALFDIDSSKKAQYFNKIDMYEFKRVSSWSEDKKEAYSSYLNKGYGKYFKKLKDKYQDTKYYDELIKECGNFANFMSKN